jgi:hypothetical protein
MPDYIFTSIYAIPVDSLPSNSLRLENRPKTTEFGSGGQVSDTPDILIL